MTPEDVDTIKALRAEVRRLEIGRLSGNEGTMLLDGDRPRWEVGR